MSEINYVVGDATRPQGDGLKFIAHICNDRGGWGRGFVVALSQRSKRPEEAYRRWHAEGDYEYATFRLGQIQTVGYTDLDTYVVNMIAQAGIRHAPGAPPAVDYVALRDCLDELGQEAMRWWNSSKKMPSIHMPRIGCGLGGGDWAVVEECILESLVDIYGLTVTVYDLPQSAS